MNIYFIRHTSVNVPKGICYGQTDVEVAATFQEEAQRVKESLRGLAFDHVFSSPLKRARMLADFCGFPHPDIDERVIEINFGDWEMKDFNELYANDPRFSTWCENYFTQAAPNGECLKDQVARFEAFIKDVSKRGCQNVAVFCHGGILAIAQAKAKQIPLKDSFREIPPFGSIVKLTV